jgi:hypothetical protein
MSDLAVGVAVVFAGVIAFALQQWVRVIYERREDRREREIEYLVDAYRALSVFMNRAFFTEDGQTYLALDRLSDDEASAAELAVSTAGLHGSPEVVKAAVEYTNAGDENWDPTDLMIALRQDLRQRLGHPPIEGDFVPWVHIDRDSDLPEASEMPDTEAEGRPNPEEE